VSPRPGRPASLTALLKPFLTEATGLPLNSTTQSAAVFDDPEGKLAFSRSQGECGCEWRWFTEWTADEVTYVAHQTFKGLHIGYIDFPAAALCIEYDAAREVVLAPSFPSS
jgi:hypothetical protein